MSQNPASEDQLFKYVSSLINDNIVDILKDSKEMRKTIASKLTDFIRKQFMIEKEASTPKINRIYESKGGTLRTGGEPIHSELYDKYLALQSKSDGAKVTQEKEASAQMISVLKSKVEELSAKNKQLKELVLYHKSINEASASLKPQLLPSKACPEAHYEERENLFKENIQMLEGRQQELRDQIRRLSFLNEGQQEEILKLTDGNTLLKSELEDSAKLIIAERRKNKELQEALHRANLKDDQNKRKEESLVDKNAAFKEVYGQYLKNSNDCQEIKNLESKIKELRVQRETLVTELEKNVVQKKEFENLICELQAKHSKEKNSFESHISIMKDKESLLLIKVEQLEEKLYSKEKKTQVCSPNKLTKDSWIKLLLLMKKQMTNLRTEINYLKNEHKTFTKDILASARSEIVFVRAFVTSTFSKLKKRAHLLQPSNYDPQSQEVNSIYSEHLKRSFT